jgi:DNA-binding NarL/FixJ family response regulator
MPTTFPNTSTDLPQAPPVRILLVEDERLVAMSLKSQLSSLGYQVVGHAASGQEAIDRADELRPDLVLMDIHLEGDMDGVEAAAEIYKQFQLPVVYLTAFSSQDILDRAKITEPMGYILKPYEERELHVVIETAVYRHHAERARSAARDAGTTQQDLRMSALSRLGSEAKVRVSELTPREAEVMELIVEGKSQKQVAATFGISIQTAAKHRSKVLEKLGVANDVELVRLALAMHLYPPRD